MVISHQDDQAQLLTERIFDWRGLTFPTCDGGDRGVPRSVAEDSNNYLQPALSGFDVVTSTVIFVNCSEVL